MYAAASGLYPVDEWWSTPQLAVSSKVERRSRGGLSKPAPQPMQAVCTHVSQFSIYRHIVYIPLLVLLSTQQVHHTQPKNPPRKIKVYSLGGGTTTGSPSSLYSNRVPWGWQCPLVASTPASPSFAHVPSRTLETWREIQLPRPHRVAVTPCCVNQLPSIMEYRFEP